MFAHLNATTTLSRAISEKGIYPAVDPLDSTSTILKPEILGEEHYRTATEVQGGAAALQGAPRGHHRHPGDRRAVRRGQGWWSLGRGKIERFLSQPFFVAEVFTGRPGVDVPVEETVRGFREILDGKHDELSEGAFYMKGTIDQVVEDARGAKAEGAEEDDGAEGAEKEDGVKDEGAEGDGEKS